MLLLVVPPYSKPKREEGSNSPLFEDEGETCLVVSFIPDIEVTRSTPCVTDECMDSIHGY
ncbi:MAG: hypothetical protein V3T88_09025 [Nitrosomonadaceae bacterium]